MSALACSRSGLDGLWGDLKDVRSRFSFRFSGTGRAAGAFAVRPDGRGDLERWHLDGEHPRCEAIEHSPVDAATIAAEGAPLEVLPFDDDILLLHRQGGRYRLTRVPGDRPAQPEPVGVVDHPTAALLPAPDGSQRTLVLSCDGAGDSALWLVDGQPLSLTLVRRFTGLVLGGYGLVPGHGWLGARSCALTCRVDGRSRVALVDTDSGDLTVLDPVADGSSDHVLLSAPRAGRLLLASDARGPSQLVEIGELGESPPRFLEPAEAFEGTVTPLTFDPSGERVLLRSQHGLRTSLHAVTVDTGETRPVPAPEGWVSGPAVWLGDPGSERIHCLLTSPSAPFEVLRLPPGGPERAERVSDVPAAREGRWIGASIEQFPGPAGPIEAIVHGREDWRDADQVAIALHGGPERAWTFKFEPLFQYLSHAGITVIAPNQRGSVDYGEAHQHAIRGCWGGPDLEDIRHLSQHIRERRRTRPGEGLLLFGRSYGAYLSLLAACCEPEAWSRVAVIAPFLSGPRLYEDASEAVRDLLDRLGGRIEIADDIGARDVLRLIPRLRAQLLFMHSADDQVVPVTQSRALHRRLVATGRSEGVDFLYQEVPGGVHGVIDRSEDRYLQLTRFLAQGLEADSGDKVFPSPALEGGWEPTNGANGSPQDSAAHVSAAP